MGATEGTELTVDELAATVGMTVRNIRAHQSRGLLPPPRIVGRTGYYGVGHVRRLEQIRVLQARGLNLAAITHVVSSGQIVDIAIGPFARDEPEYRDGDELVASLGLEAGDPTAERAVELGLIAFERDRVRVEEPRLMAVAEQLVEQGVPLAAQLDAVAAVQVASRQISDVFMELADQHLIAAVAAETKGDPEQIRAAVERLRGYANEALVVLFNQSMATAIRAYFEPPPLGADATEG